jgi:excinuclease UvrABC nuclease subunit
MVQALGPDADELSGLIHRLDAEMGRAAAELRFEEAALLRDEISELRSFLVRDPVDGSMVLPGDTADVDIVDPQPTDIETADVEVVGGP